MSRPFLRWGILGTGMIAEKFARELSGNGILTAVASRQLASSEEFLQRLPRSVTSGETTRQTSAVEGYEALLARTDLDAIYIALPNALHCEWTCRALRAGKHVLCEKPMALSVAEAEEMFAVARECDRFLLEGFMYRAQEQTEQLFQFVHSGKLGDLRLIRANFTFNRPASAEDARYVPGPGGGSIMDVGCYCIDFARSITGEEPAEAHAVIHQHELGVDDYAAGTLVFPGGALMTFTCGMTVVSDQTTHVAGTTSRLEIPRFWQAGEGFAEVLPAPPNVPPKINRHGWKKRRGPALYGTEARAFAEVVAGTRPNWNPPENTIGNMRVLETLRA